MNALQEFSFAPRRLSVAARAWQHKRVMMMMMRDTS
jgi:hypothetical protein